MLPSETKQLIRESWRTARGDVRPLTRRFYERLFELAPSVRPLFPLDMRAQRRKLADSLHALVNALDDPSTVIMALTRLAERHDAYGARPEHYPVVGDALLDALRDQLGEEFTPQVEAAWAELYGIASKVMIDAQQAAGV